MTLRYTGWEVELSGMRKCKNCSNVLIKRPKESSPCFRRRKFCSHICANDYAKKHDVGWYGEWLDFRCKETLRYAN